MGSSQSLLACCQLFVFLNLCYENMYLCMVSPAQKRLEFLPRSMDFYLQLTYFVVREVKSYFQAEVEGGGHDFIIVKQQEQPVLAEKIRKTL